MGRQLARRSSRHLIDSFGSPFLSLPTLYGSLRLFLTEVDLCRVINLFSYAVVSLRFLVSVLTAPVTHQVLDLQNNESSSPLRPLSAFADPENLRFQAVSNSCLSGLVVVSQPLVAHGVGGQDIDDLVSSGWNG